AGSGGKPWPSFGVALATFSEPHWDALANSRPLRRWRLVETSGNESLVSNPLRIDERILFFLTGVSHLDERLIGLVRAVPPQAELSASQATVLTRLTNAWQSALKIGSIPPAVQLCGADLSAKRAVAAHLTGQFGINLFSLTAAAVPTNLGELEMLLR